MPRRRQGPEEQLQRAVVEWLDLIKPPCIWFHPPNGGYRTKAEAGVFKALGTKPGVPDLVFVRRGWVGFMELKAPRGRLSPSQEAFRDTCLTWGIDYRIVRSLDEAEAVVADWMREWSIK